MRDLSIIIPAFNAASDIGRTLFSIASFLDERGCDDEVIVVNDGSDDNTAGVAQGYAHLFKHFHVLSNERSVGKGHAVRKGMLTGTGSYRLFLDADSAVDIREFDRLVAAAENEPIAPGVIIGLLDPHPSHNATSAPAGLAGLTGRILQRAMLPGIQSSQLGFKVFCGDAADAIFRRCESNGWAFDVEALAYARGLGYHVLEVPVAWQGGEVSTVSATDYLTTSLEVARMKSRVEREMAEHERV